jgi:isoaspartyl peptidase/L-asparaginase-like protein (Ntn-hydrolase superfamily)
MQVGYLAIDKEGNYGAYAIHSGFNYALHLNGENKMHDTKSFIVKS